MSYEWFRRATLARGEADYVETLSTLGSKLRTMGLSILKRKSSAGGSTQLYVLPAPSRAGLYKALTALDATSSRSIRVTSSACGIASSAGSSGLTKITFKKANQGVNLISQSTTSWKIAGQFSSKSAAQS